MKRTNIYLDEAQSAALEQVARTQGISRAELIRHLIDRSFGTARGEDVTFGRGSDERAQHLDRMAEL
jgi:hypothetical protein